MPDNELSNAAALLGRKGGAIGGKSTSEAKRKASAANGKLGGKPKTCGLRIAAIWVDCPYCGASQAEKYSGSLLWEVDAISERCITCFDCGRDFYLPKRV